MLIHTLTHLTAIHPALPWRQVLHWFGETEVNQRAALACWHSQAGEGNDTEHPAQVTML